MRTESEPLPLVVAGIARRQHGIVSRAQLLEAGLSTAGIKRWLASGRLHRIHRGVYAVGHTLISQEGRWLAAVLACGPGSYLSHGPAGQLSGIVPRRERFALHVSTPGRKMRSPAGIIGHTSRNLDVRDTTTRIRIPTTTPTRTIWDLATSRSPTQVRGAFEQAERQDLLDRHRLAELLAASPAERVPG